MGVIAEGHNAAGGDVIGASTTCVGPGGLTRLRCPRCRWLGRRGRRDPPHTHDNGGRPTWPTSRRRTGSAAPPRRGVASAGPPSTKVRRVTTEDLIARREAILKDLGLTSDELRAKVESGGLVGREWSAWSEIEDIDYLLVSD